MDKWLLRYEQYSKDANINLRLPEAMLKALRDGAFKKKIPDATLYPHHARKGIDGGTGRRWPRREVAAEGRRQASEHATEFSLIRVQTDPGRVT